MENKLANKEKELLRLQNRVRELEQQFAEAKAAIPASPSSRGNILQVEGDQQKAEELNAMIQTLHDPVMVYDQNGVIYMANASAMRAHGFDPTRHHRQETNQTLMVRYPSGEIADSDDLPSARALKGETVIDEALTITNSNGQELSILVSSSPLIVNGIQKGAVSVWHDVTVRKQTEERLRAARDEAMWLARLPGENPNPVARVSNEGIILYHNLVAANLPGWRLAINELLPMPLRRLLQQALTEGRIVEQDVSFGQQIYAVTIVPISGEDYANVYGRDVTAHKKAEDALRESERRQREIARLLELDQARLAAILRHLPVGVWIVDQQGRLIGSNPEADRIWAGEAPMLDSTADFQKYVSWHPGSGELLKPDEYPIAVALRTGEAVEPMETNILRFDGSEGTVLASAVPIKDSRGQLMGVVAVNVDITDRKNAEEALRQSEERFAKAFHAGPDAMVIGRLADGLIMEVNEGWSKIFGHKPTEVLGQKALELDIYVDPEDRKTAVGHLKENGFLRDFELQIRRKSGEVRQATMSAERIEINGVDCLLAVIRDITEQKQAEQDLRVSEQRLKRAQEIAHLGSWELDIATNQLTWSDEVYRIFGLQPQEFHATYEAFLEAVHPDDRAAVDAVYSGSIQAGRDQYEIEHRVIKRSNGEIRIVHEKCEHIRNREGQIIRSIGMVHDITERKRAEEQLKDYAERLEHSNRELEQFAFMASHDLQEPLRKIEMFGDLLLERSGTLDDREQGYLDRMRSAAGRMRDMVTGLLQLSRIATQVRPFVSVDLSQVTSEVLSDMEEKIRRLGGKVEYSALPSVEGDPTQLRQLIQNLIGNALKYHQPDTPPNVKVFAKQRSEQVQIFVEDQGIGFEQEDAERIFQPFQRLVGHSQYEGSGIGLAICRRIVERHAGNIIALSKPEQGTTFIVTLPLAHPKNAKNELQKDVNDETPGTAPRR